MTRIAFITEDLHPWNGRLSPGGCAYYRCMLPANAAGPGAMFGKPAWSAELGFGVVQGGYARFGFDQVMLKMVMARWTPMQMEAAKRLGQRLIVDVDDHYDKIGEDNIAFHTTDPSVNPIHNRDNFRKVVELADVVTVTTPELYDHYAPHVKDIRLIRNGVNPKQFTRHKQKNRKPVIGWVGAIGWRQADVKMLRPWLGPWLEKHDLMFHHAGHMPDQPSFAELADLDPSRVSTSPMEAITEYASMLTFDIGIVPMVDSPFNRAKSTNKGLEYALSGIPFVASALPEYERLADMGVGRVAAHDWHWQAQLDALLDYRVRKHEAAVQYDRVLRQHTIVQRAPEWVELFSEGAPSRVPDKIVRWIES